MSSNEKHFLFVLNLKNNFFEFRNNDQKIKFLWEKKKLTQNQNNKKQIRKKNQGFLFLPCPKKERCMKTFRLNYWSPSFSIWLILTMNTKAHSIKSNTWMCKNWLVRSDCCLKDVDSLFAPGCIDINSHCPPAKMDDRIQMIFAHLVNGLFKIMPEALTCNFSPGNPETPAQSAMCTLRSIIDAQKKQVKEDVARRVEELFNPGNKQAVLSLPEILPANWSDFHWRVDQFALSPACILQHKNKSDNAQCC